MAKNIEFKELTIDMGGSNEKAISDIIKNRGGTGDLMFEIESNNVRAVKMKPKGTLKLNRDEWGIKVGGQEKDEVPVYSRGFLPGSKKGYIISNEHTIYVNSNSKEKTKNYKNTITIGKEDQDVNIKFTNIGDKPAPSPPSPPASPPSPSSRRPVRKPPPPPAGATGPGVTNIENFKFTIDDKTFELDGETIQKLLKDDAILDAVKDNYKEEELESNMKGTLSENKEAKTRADDKKRKEALGEEIKENLETEAQRLNVTVEQLSEYQNKALEQGDGNVPKLIAEAKAAGQLGGGIEGEKIDIVSLKIGGVDLKDKLKEKNSSLKIWGEADSEAAKAEATKQSTQKAAADKKAAAEQRAAESKANAQKMRDKGNSNEKTSNRDILKEVTREQKKILAEKAEQAEARAAAKTADCSPGTEQPEVCRQIKGCHYTNDNECLPVTHRIAIAEKKEARAAGPEGASGSSGSVKKRLGPLSVPMNPGFTGTPGQRLRAKLGGAGKKNKVVDNLPIPGSKSGMKRKKTKRGKIGGNKKQTRKK